MLQNIRDNAQGTIAKIIIFLIAISFAFFGIESLVGGGKQVAASVNGEDVTPRELERTMLAERNRRMNAMGENVDPAQLEQDVLREAALKQIIQQRLLLQAAQEADITVADSSVDQTILGMQQFQEGGKFSQQLYQNILRSNGYTPAYFKQMLHSDLVIGQLSNGVTASEFVTAKELDDIAGVVGQRRSFSYLVVPPKLIDDKVDVTDADIEQYYHDNPSQFQTPDRVKLNYIEVRQQDFFKPVPEDEIRLAYQQEMEQFQSGEERRASHILIQIGDGRDKQEALGEAQDIRKQIADGKDFAELAKKYSEDPGSAKNGGDLGYTAGETFPSEFEEALFALSLNQVSQPVLTDAGYHLIKATDIKETDSPTYEERKPIIEEMLKMSDSESEFVTNVEELKDLVFNSDGLKGPAKELNLQVKTSDWVSRDAGEGVFADPRVRKAAFSDEVLKNGHNSAVIELAPDHYVVVTVTEHNPPHQRELAKVEGEIRKVLQKQQRIEQGQKIAGGVIDKVKAGQSREEAAKSVDSAWIVNEAVQRNSKATSRELLQAVFRLPVPQGDAPQVETVTLRSGEVAVIILDEVIPGKLDDLSAPERVALRKEILNALQTLSTSGFVNSLREKAEIEIN